MLNQFLPFPIISPITIPQIFMPLLYQPRIFKPYTAVRAGVTLRSVTARDRFGNNMSLTVGDNSTRVEHNRERAAASLGFRQLATQRQVHGNACHVVGPGYSPAESDALISDEPGWLLAVSVADCIPVLLFAEQRKVVAAVHSGWRGSQHNITGATIAQLLQSYGVAPDELIAYIGPAASQCCYEVGNDVATQFAEQHSRPLGEGKFLFDNKGVVLAQLFAAGIPTSQIELDPRCTICAPNFHSYRRDGSHSGRMFGVIGLVG